MGDFRITDQGDDRGGGVDNRHLPGHGNRLVAGGILGIVGDRVLTRNIRVQGIVGQDGDIGVVIIRNLDPIVNEGGLDLNGHLRIAQQLEERYSGIGHMDGALDLGGLVAGDIRCVVGHRIVTQLLVVDAVDDHQPGGNFSVNGICNICTSIRVVGLDLDGDVRLTRQGDDRCRGVDHCHLARCLDRSIANRIRHIIGDRVLTGNIGINRVDHRGLKAFINVVGNGHTRIRVGGSTLMRDLGIANKGDDRAGGIHHRHLARHLDRRITGGVGDIIADGVLAGLGLVHRVDHHRLKVRVVIV